MRRRTAEPPNAEARLHDAVIALIHEKHYDRIAVREILDRAHVSRSTFYTHFTGKDDLFASAVHDLLRSAPHTERLTWFSLPIFEYVDRHRRTRDADSLMPYRAVAHDRLRTIVAELIRDEATGCRLPRDVVADHLAATFVRVLNWWVNSRSGLGAADVNNLFRSLVAPAIRPL